MRLLRLLVRIFFRQIVIQGRDLLPPGRPVIFTPNHPNALLDPLLLMFLSPAFRIRFVAKAPLFKIPVFGWILRWMGAIPVVRRFETEGEVNYAAFFSACLDVLARGDCLGIFPEGRSLPQPFVAPLKTGVARLFFLARERGIDVRIVPVGLNFERGSIFRSSVVVSLSPPLDAAQFVALYQMEPQDAVRRLTEAIHQMLEQHVFQAESFRDRELMLLLERLYATDDADDSWPQRLARLKQFEAGLAKLRQSGARDIDRLRNLLTRYGRLSRRFGRDQEAARGWAQWTLRQAFFAVSGFPVAMIGWLLNWLPYKLTGWLVRLSKQDDEASAATFKVVYSIFLFPLIYIVEGAVFRHWLGQSLTIMFAVGIVPLSFFTLRYFEWLESYGGHQGIIRSYTGRRKSNHMAERLAPLRQRIIEQVDALAARIES